MYLFDWSGDKQDFHYPLQVMVGGDMTGSVLWRDLTTSLCIWGNFWRRQTMSWDGWIFVPIPSDFLQMPFGWLFLTCTLSGSKSWWLSFKSDLELGFCRFWNSVVNWEETIRMQNHLTANAVPTLLWSWGWDGQHALWTGEKAQMVKTSGFWWS